MNTLATLGAALVLLYLSIYFFVTLSNTVLGMALLGAFLAFAVMVIPALMDDIEVMFGKKEKG